MNAERRTQSAEFRIDRRRRFLHSAFCALRSAFFIVLIALPLPAQNRLTHAKSPYLRQHSTNPIDWHPWGTEPFTKAKNQDKPIFLSIGYSTCHWCHVMEKESFADQEIGALLNATFVSIKVDREERPDIDSVYMAAARTLTGDAGWPLNVILTPDGKPLFAASYLPKDKFRGVIERFSTLWRDQRAPMLASADMVVRALRPSDVAADAGLDAATLARGYQQLAARFDSTHGGFLPEPKFPSAHHLMFLLRYWHRTGEPRALEMVETTLRAMRGGGIYDKVGFGFHRYASDAAWREPHYEKMLYDQALLAMAYLEAYQATGKSEYASVAREIFTYVLRDLRAPNGAFYTAHDADEAYYKSQGRAKKPHRDEKILTDWNGLMIAALSMGAVVLDDKSYADAATRAANAVVKNGRLLHQTGQSAYLDDYAFLIWGLLNLYEATFDLRWLEKAIALEDESMRFFRDASGRFYLTATDAETLLVRPWEAGDGALPAGNSVQLMNLVRLARITAREDYAKHAEQLVRATADDVSLAPSAATHLLSALDFLLGPSFEIVLAGDDPAALRRTVFAAFVPNKVVLHRPSGENPPIARLAPFTREQKPIAKKTTAYVCTNYACRLPTSDAAKVAELIARKPARRYLFYLHGRAIEEHGRNAVTEFGRYEYDAILEAFAEKGFVVLSEARKKGTEYEAYARVIESQIRELLAEGVPARNITVVGASKGAIITMLASTYLQNRDVAFVVMGNCNDEVLDRWKPKMAGRLLSIYDAGDDFGGTCAKLRNDSITAYDEIRLDTGLRHGFLYKPLPEWIDPAAKWSAR